MTILAGVRLGPNLLSSTNFTPIDRQAVNSYDAYDIEIFSGHLPENTTRTLSFESDALNAFRGLSSSSPCARSEVFLSSTQKPCPPLKLWTKISIQASQWSCCGLLLLMSIVHYAVVLDFLHGRGQASQIRRYWMLNISIVYGGLNRLLGGFYILCSKPNRVWTSSSVRDWSLSLWKTSRVFPVSSIPC
jgi:hypothetical protein